MSNSVIFYTSRCAESRLVAEFIENISKRYDLTVQTKDIVECSQVDFMLDIHKNLAVIVDATIPKDLKGPTVYPILTAHVNILNHIIVFSRETDEEGNEILPLNISPQRKRRKKDVDLQLWIETQLNDIISHNGYYDRLEVETLDELLHHQSDMEKMMAASLGIPKDEPERKKSVMISYRNKYANEVKALKERKEKEENIEVKALPPGSLCGDYEAHTPMRRWMLVGLLEDHIRTVDEVWVYLTEDYTDSWWTLAEIIMTMNLNYERKEGEKIKICVYDPNRNDFLSEDELPSYLIPQISESHHKRLARYLSNTRPDTMGPEMLQQVRQMKQLAKILRYCPYSIKEQIIENLRESLSASIPTELPKDQKEEMLKEMLAMYSNPDELEKYASDDVFQEAFWNNISYQVSKTTSAFTGGKIDVDAFMRTPMLELSTLDDRKLSKTCKKNGTVKVSNNDGVGIFNVSVGTTRYLWLATRMGQPTIKDAPGLEVIQTYDLLFKE